MFGSGMGDFMAHHHGQPGFIFSYGQNSRIDSHLAAGHAPGVDGLRIINQVKFPLIMLNVLGHSLLAEKFLGGPGNSRSHGSYHLNSYRVMGEPGFPKNLLILLKAHGGELGIIY